MKILHVIAGVGQSAPAELQAAHKDALESVAHALSESENEIEVVIVGLPGEEPAGGPWRFEPTTLEPLGKSGFKTVRRLPYLSDIIRPLQQSGDFALGILTNADIRICPTFYTDVADRWVNKPLPTSITRMTLSTEFHDVHTKNHSGESGQKEHPGHDCFIADQRSWRNAHVGEVVVGVQGVMKPLIWSLGDIGRPVQVLHGSGLTSHVGDDRVWTHKEFSDYRDHNKKALNKLARETVNSRGQDAMDASPSLRSWLGGTNESLIFSLNPGRSGSESLARQLSRSSNAISGHEREPIMMGPWLRMVGFEGLASTRRLRNVKYRAIKVERELFGSGAYIDTSHLFLYTFADVVMEQFEGSDIAVVRLHRDPLKVAKSFFELGYFSRQSTLGPDWHFWPTWPASYFPISTSDITSEWDLVFGSLVDFYRRQDAFLQKNKGKLRVIPMRTSDLNDPAWLDSLTSNLGVSPVREADSSKNSKIWNTKKGERVRSIQYDQVEREFSLFCQRFAIDRAELESLGWDGPFQ